jgi:protoheme IX farnesyltransferase
MLPNVAGREETKRQIWIYTLLTIPASVLPLLTGTAGALYAAGAVLLTGKFLFDALQVYRAPNRARENRTAKKLFLFSIIWLFAMFALILAEKLLHIPAFPKVM